MRIFGLLGYPLSHSFSKSFFTEKFEKEKISDCRYENFSFEKISEAISFLKTQQGLSGLNVTIPHKVNVLEFLDDQSSVCQKIQSCNCIKIEGGKWIGNNTDVTGFSNSITPLLKPEHNNALVFGTGGASKAVCFVLEELQIPYQLVSRKPSSVGVLSYEDINVETIRTHPVLINTTPVGLYPHTEKAVPIPYHAITPGHLAYDLIYNPAETLFLRKAKEQGASIKNGEEMLIIQAEESWKIWNS